MKQRLPEIRRRLTRLARKHNVPGASLGILKGKQVLEVVTGVTNVNTGVEVTPDSLFQIGSNTKLYTTTLVMQLVDAKEVDLDEPVKTYVPELARRRSMNEITVRMLLTHTSGIEGDHFEDFGRGDDGLALYVKSLRKIGQIHPPGAMWSYCNAGFCLAGRIVETVTGEPFHRTLRERLLDPLGLHATTVLPEEMLKHRYAVGHIVLPERDPFLPPTVLMSSSQTPAGSMTSSTPREVLAFVRMHLDGGRTPDGKKVLNKRSVQAMQRKQADLPAAQLGSRMGLGWLMSTWDGHRVIGHGGGTIGQLSFLQVLPEKRFAVFLATNSTGGGALWAELAPYLFSELARVEMPRPSTNGERPDVDLARFAGRYRRLGVDAELTVDGDRLAATLTGTGPMANLMGSQQLTFTPATSDTFLTPTPAGPSLLRFLDFDRSGRPRYAHLGGRAMQRARVPSRARKG